MSHVSCLSHISYVYKYIIYRILYPFVILHSNNKYRSYEIILVNIDLVTLSFLNLKDGFGTMTWPDGDSYVGAWVGGKREGWGAYYWNNGNSYQV